MILNVVMCDMYLLWKYLYFHSGAYEKKEEGRSAQQLKTAKAIDLAGVTIFRLSLFCHAHRKCNS